MTENPFFFLFVFCGAGGVGIIKIMSSF